MTSVKRARFQQFAVSMLVLTLSVQMPLQALAVEDYSGWEARPLEDSAAPKTPAASAVTPAQAAVPAAPDAEKLLKPAEPFIQDVEAKLFIKPQAGQTLVYRLNNLQTVLFGEAKYQDAGQLLSKLAEVFPQEAAKAEATLMLQLREETLKAQAVNGSSTFSSASKAAKAGKNSRKTKSGDTDKTLVQGNSVGYPHQPYGYPSPGMAPAIVPGSSPSIQGSYPAPQMPGGQAASAYQPGVGGEAASAPQSALGVALPPGYSMLRSQFEPQAAAQPEKPKKKRFWQGDDDWADFENDSFFNDRASIASTSTFSNSSVGSSYGNAAIGAYSGGSYAGSASNGSYNDGYDSSNGQGNGSGLRAMGQGLGALAMMAGSLAGSYYLNKKIGGNNGLYPNNNYPYNNGYYGAPYGGYGYPPGSYPGTYAPGVYPQGVVAPYGAPYGYYGTPYSPYGTYTHNYTPGTIYGSGSQSRTYTPFPSANMTIPPLRF